jgi:hypothetical protein
MKVDREGLVRLCMGLGEHRVWLTHVLRTSEDNGRFVFTHWEVQKETPWRSAE